MLRFGSGIFTRVSFVLLLTACSGGGGSPPTGPGPVNPVSPGPTSTPVSNPNPTSTPISAVPTPTPTPTAAPAGTTASGRVVSIPVGSYGSGAPASSLAGAVVVVGSVAIQGATVPMTLPAGDVATTTASDGSFTVIVPSGPAAPPAGTFVLPYNNAYGVNPPATGYFVEVFAPGVDGKSAGAPLPNHSFLGISSGSVGTLRVTTASSDEAGWLALMNSDRSSKGVGQLIFDETTLEVARQHANADANANDYCHYDPNTNQGPMTRYGLSGGLYQNLENLGFSGGGNTTTQTYQKTKAGFVAEGPGGVHYDPLFNSTNIWAGPAVVANSSGNTILADQEMANPGNSSPLGYPNKNCPAGITANNS
jgi:uncharacterized protein YkwD